MSEIKNVGYIWMAVSTFKCNCLTPLHFKGLNKEASDRPNAYQSVIQPLLTVNKFSVAYEKADSWKIQI